MPEGDTLHRIADALAPRLEGRVLRAIEVPRSDARVRDLVGVSVERVRAYGKYLVIELGCGVSLLTHLRMDGLWHAYEPGARWRRSRGAMRVMLEVEGTVAVCFSAPVVRFVRTRELARLLGPEHLGPDILGESFDVGDALLRLARSPDVPLGVALLDQRRIAGIGNVYKSEVCFHARLSPLARVSTVERAALERLVVLTREVMQDNVAKRRPGADARRHHAPHYLYERDTTLAARRTTPKGCEVGKGPIFVYGRAGKPCFVCGAAIVRTYQGDARRSTYRCPVCQEG
ncbi:MAG: Fpg/Nei family DNA glycosylase [Deltaproteobacteria bacterium]|nr:Fpg/Nei family DNA glycosylase [Deltaproteobacteria bacterium]